MLTFINCYFYRYFTNCIDYSGDSFKMNSARDYYEIVRRDLDWTLLKNLSKLTILYVKK